MSGRILTSLSASLLVLALTAASPPTWGKRWAISVDDYPPAARRANLIGMTRYELAVDAAGVPTNCTIIKSSGHQILDDRTCELVMKRARFNPARDDAGNAVAGTFRHQVWWQLAPVQTFEPAFAGFAVTVAFDSAGVVTSCAVASLVKGFELGPNQAGLCGSMGNAAAFAELLDRPTAGLTSATYRFWLKDRRFEGRLPTDQPVRRELAHVVFDTSPAGINWCEVVVAPTRPVAGLGETDLCGPKAYGVTHKGGGGYANDLYVDVIATKAGDAAN